MKVKDIIDMIDEFTPLHVIVKSNVISFTKTYCMPKELKLINELFIKKIYVYNDNLCLVVSEVE